LIEQPGAEPESADPDQPVDLEPAVDLELEVDPADEAMAGDLPHRRFETWRRRSGLGAVGTGVALGLQEIFYPTNDRPVITAPAPGDPPDADERIRVTLDPDDPTKSVAVIPPQAESAEPSDS
jgi:hypothetical protein